MADANTPRPSIGHETTDVSTTPLIYISVLGIGVVLLFILAMWILLGFEARRQSELSPAANPLAATFARKEPPEPRLQAHPLEDLAAMRAREKAVLDSYAWVDEGAGVVRIPIARAKELLVARGLGRTESAGGAR